MCVFFFYIKRVPAKGKKKYELSVSVCVGGGGSS